MTAILAVVGGVYVFALVIVAMSAAGCAAATWWLDHHPRYGHRPRRPR